MNPIELAEVEIAQIEKEYGEPIEPKIRPTVIALYAHGLSTSGSCEGHVEYERNPYPWVIFSIKSDGESEKALETCLEKGWKELGELKRLLSHFYEGEQAPPLDQRLVAITHIKSIEDMPLTGEEEPYLHFFTYTLRCAGAKALESLPQEICNLEQRDAILKRHQNEMERFNTFLRKWFDE